MPGIKTYSAPGVISGSLAHSGTTVGFYGATPVTRPAAYTLTFSGTSRVLPASTATGGGTLLTEAFTQLAALVTDLTETKKVLNQLIRDLQSEGLLQ